MVDDVYGGAKNKGFLRGNKYGKQCHIAILNLP